MYSIVKGIILDQRVEGNQLRDIILVDRPNATILQNKYHQMQIGIKGKFTIFNYNTNVLKCLKLMEVDEDITNHENLFKIEKEN